MIAKGWGQGNCFYLGVKADAYGSHRFQCRNLGKLAVNSKLELAFQYSLSNFGKKFTHGKKATSSTGLVVQVAKTLTCTLKINTFTDATSSAVNWYEAAFTAQVDGNAQASLSGQWQSFIGVKATFGSLGQKTADTNYELGDKAVDAEMWLLLSKADAAVRTDDFRQFPFDTSGTANALMFRAYGVSLLAAAKMTIALAASDKFSQAGKSLNGFGEKTEFVLDDAVYKD
jgi:hypothetical protein